MTATIVPYAAGEQVHAHYYRADGTMAEAVTVVLACEPSPTGWTLYLDLPDDADHGRREQDGGSAYATTPDGTHAYVRRFAPGA